VARYDLLLIDPSNHRLAVELMAAEEHANREAQVLDPLDWGPFFARLEQEPEGRQQWSDSRRGETARVVVTWWTDHVHRRHVQIVAGNGRDRSFRNLSSTRTDPRPPLWHLYPQGLFWRERDGRGEWWTVCRCGVAGPPARLGWMGECCGVCHDRQQEGVVSPKEVLAGTFMTFSGAGRPFAFSPDGHWLAEGAEAGVVRLIHLNGEARHHLPALEPAATWFTFSPDGQLLAAVCENRLVVTELESKEAVLDEEWSQQIHRVAFAPDGRALAVGGAAGLRIWQRGPDTAHWRLTYQDADEVNALAWSPDGQRLALAAGRQVRLFDLLCREKDPPLEPPLGSLHAFLDDLLFIDGGKGLLCLSSCGDLAGSWALSASLVGPGSSHFDGEVRHYDLSTRPPRLVASQRIADLSQGRFSPDGTRLAWLHSGEPTVRIRKAPFTGRDDRDDRVGWDLEARLVDLLFSPDGQTLATLASDGTLKLIPWRLLLEP
jgi:WD40 repeat protein